MIQDKEPSEKDSEMTQQIESNYEFIKNRWYSGAVRRNKSKQARSEYLILI